MNPLMQMMGMGQMIGGNPMMAGMQNIIGMIRGKDPNSVARMLAQKNPQFAQFMQSCQGKSIDQVCKEYGVDQTQLRQFMQMLPK